MTRQKHTVVELENNYVPFDMDFETDGAYLIPNRNFNGNVPEWVDYIEDNAHMFLEWIQECKDEHTSIPLPDLYHQFIVDDACVPFKWQRKFTDDDIPVIDDAINSYLKDFDMNAFAHLLTVLTNTIWRLYCIQGASQGDWQYLMVPKTSSLNVRYFEAFYFGQYSLYLVDDEYEFVVPYYRVLDDALQDEFGTNCDIELKVIDGYVQVPKYSTKIISL